MRRQKGKLFIAILAILLLAGAFWTGNLHEKVRQLEIKSISTEYTGQDIWNTVNAYRKQNGIGELTLDDRYCTNLAQRYLDIRKGLDEGTAHAKFEEWVHKYIPQGYYVSEDFAGGSTAQEVLDQWIGSPGHRLSILDPKSKIGCSYASDGAAVIELGYSNK